VKDVEEDGSGLLEIHCRHLAEETLVSLENPQNSLANRESNLGPFVYEA
jgi:hypothetical protein